MYYIYWIKYIGENIRLASVKNLSQIKLAKTFISNTRRKVTKSTAEVAGGIRECTFGIFISHCERRS